jgi:hypothetical protein
MRHRSCWSSGLMLVLVAGGLLLMHGLDGPRHHVAAAGSSQVAGASHETPMTGHAAAATTEGAATTEAVTASGASNGADHLGALGHVMAMCVAVLAVAAGRTVLRRLSMRPLAVVVAPVAAAQAWACRAMDALRQPTPDRLELCILRI